MAIHSQPGLRQMAGYVLALLLLAGTLASRAWAAPSTITIQGRLTNSLGKPLTGARVWRVQFYDALTNGSALGAALTGTVTVAATGRFTIALTPPAQALAATGALYYGLAIDSAATPDGAINAGDVFPGRVLVSSVMYAQKLVGTVTDAQVPNDITITERDTLATVSSRGAVTATQLVLGDGINLPAQAPPAAWTDRLIHTGASLYWNGAPLMTCKGSAYVIVQTTDSATNNGLNLIAAYSQAKLLTPQGQPLSASNRAAVLLPPGSYDLGSAPLNLDAEFVDLAGLSSARADQLITGTPGGTGAGVLHQQASDVHLENLTVSCDFTGFGNYDPSFPAAYFPESNLAGAYVRNCEFKGAHYGVATRLGVVYSGTYDTCAGGSYSFGCFAGGDASGVFKNCTASGFSFGSLNGTASGVFRNCNGGDGCFGGSGGTASGTFDSCTGANQSFGGGILNNTYYGKATGTFINCTGGDYSFGSSNSSGVCSGTFTNCRGGQQSFGGNGTVNTSARLYGCQMTVAGWSGAFGGKMENCHWETGITLSASARIYNSTFLGTLALGNTAAGVTQSRARAITGAGSNIFGATNTAALNIINAGVQ